MVKDNMLITGQNPASSQDGAKKLLTALEMSNRAQVPEAKNKTVYSHKSFIRKNIFLSNREQFNCIFYAVFTPKI